MKVIAFLALSLCLSAAAPGHAQTGSRSNDPNAIPQGPDAPRRADTQNDGQAVQAEARAECRGEATRRERRDCVREARKEIDQERLRRSAKRPRPASTPQ
jgi:hypothetical protein